MKTHINRLLQLFKIKIQRIESIDYEQYFLAHLSDELSARQKFLKYFDINVLLDVGANSGQYATTMRRIGYSGKIVSFEPLSSAFAELSINSINDVDWHCENFALGDREENGVIHVSGNSYSSSLLDILPTHIAYDADSEYVSEETIQVKRLDNIFNEYCLPTESIMLKIDTQGFEMKVLEGARESLKHVTILQLEISIEPLYNKEVLFVEMVNFLETIGFKLFTLENGIRNPESGKLLQVDGVFLNTKKTNKL